MNQQPQEEQQRMQKALGSRIRNLRHAQHWPSKSALARACGINRATLVAIERGTANLELYTLLQIAKHLQITVSDLFYDIASDADHTQPNFDLQDRAWNGRPSKT